jgi:hypothetical protein
MKWLPSFLLSFLSLSFPLPTHSYMYGCPLSWTVFFLICRSYLHPLPLTEELPPLTASKAKKAKGVSREIIPCKHENEHYIINSRGYQRQYSHLYLTRLHMMKEVLTNAAKDKWGHLEGVQFAKRLLDVQPDVPAVIVGTVYKEMSRKPSILEEFSKDVCSNPSLSLIPSASSFSLI